MHAASCATVVTTSNFADMPFRVESNSSELARPQIKLQEWRISPVKTQV
mgnify:CR=1 FL=1